MRGNSDTFAVPSITRDSAADDGRTLGPIRLRIAIDALLFAPTRNSNGPRFGGTGRQVAGEGNEVSRHTHRTLEPCSDRVSFIATATDAITRQQTPETVSPRENTVAADVLARTVFLRAVDGALRVKLGCFVEGRTLTRQFLG